MFKLFMRSNCFVFLKNYFSIVYLSACFKHSADNRGKSAVICENTELWSFVKSLSHSSWLEAKIDLNKYASTDDSNDGASYKVCKMMMHLFYKKIQNSLINKI